MKLNNQRHPNTVTRVISALERAGVSKEALDTYRQDGMREEYGVVQLGIPDFLEDVASIFFSKGVRT